MIFINAFILGIFNLLYKYEIVQNMQESYENNTSFLSSYLTKSNVETPYLKIFLLSTFISIIVYFIMVLVLSRVYKKEMIYIIKKLNNYIFTLGIIVSTLSLFLNVILGLVLLTISFIYYLIIMYKRFGKKTLIIVLFNIVLFLTLYFISL